MPPQAPFGKERDVKLIRLVEMHPLIYNASHESYLDAEKRELAWEAIGQQLKTPARSCKTRWINIRDNLRRKMREREKMKMNPMIPVNTMYNTYRYKYESELEFLYPFFRITAVDDEHVEEISTDFEGPWVEPNESVIVNNDSDYEDKMKPDMSHLITESNLQEASSSYNDISMLKEKCKCSSNAKTEGKPQVDSVEVFLNAVGTTLRELNPYYLNIAKTRIFQVVQDCELQQIVNKGEVPIPTTSTS